MLVVVVVNLAMSLVVLPRLETGFLEEARCGATSLAAVGGVWSVATALLVAIVGGGPGEPPPPSRAARDDGCRRQCLGPAGAEHREHGGLRRGCGGVPAFAGMRDALAAIPAARLSR